MAKLKTVPYNPEQEEKLDQLIQSAFNEAVRKERRNLLLFSTVSLLIAIANVTPSSVLGMSFSEVSHRVALSFLFFVNCYFILNFWLYASPLDRSARKAKQDQDSNRLEVSAHKGLWRIRVQNSLSKGRYLIWFNVEYVLPIVLGILALHLILTQLAVRKFGFC